MSKLFIEAHDEHEDIVVVEGENSKISVILTYLKEALLIALVFLFPLFFIPVLRDQWELPKQLLLLGFMTLVGLVWLLEILFTRLVALRKTFLFFFLGMYGLAVSLATITSLDKYGSLFGGSSGAYASLASLIGFFLFVFFGLNSLRIDRLIRRALTALFFASFLMAMVALFEISGLAIPYLPPSLFWNPLGSPFTFGFFEAIVVLLSSGVLLWDSAGQFRWGSILLRSLALAAGATALLFLFFLDWRIAWLIVAGGTGLLLLFLFVFSPRLVSFFKTLFSVVAFVVALLFLLVRTPYPLRVSTEIAPNLAVSWQVAKGTLQEHPAFGSGPATYALDFARYRPASLSASAFWNVRFDRGVNYFLTLLPTVGLVGGFLWLLFLGVVTGGGIRRFWQSKEGNDRLMFLTFFIPWLGVVVGQFLHHSNMTLEFIFWFLTIIVIGGISRKFLVSDFVASPRALLGVSLGGVVFVVTMAILLLLGISRGRAWVSFSQAIRANAVSDISGTREALVRATLRDPRTDVFSRNLAQVRLLEALRAGTPREAQTLLNAALASARRATELGSADAANWMMLGSIARELTPFVEGAGELGLDAFRRARELEPQNPVYPTEAGRVALLRAERLRGQVTAKDEVVRAAAQTRLAENLSEAEQLFSQAIELKQDYAPAHFYLALTLERQGRVAEAIGRMEAVAAQNPRDVGVIFQLGLLYLNSQQWEKAEGQFTAALALSPNYANAHWYLASIYESRGNLDGAIREIEAVATFDPTNQMVQDRLRDLRQGRAAAELPAPVEEREEEF
ncbi:tetratricopeptide repeat protein [Candidatus Uhrbacteria bacterium]|nr:tetratricopeptide repeat protein [Candidatus Uhrbacteria bacterium]